MLKVKNRRTIHSLAMKSLRANRLRNVVAVLAIALTAMLFTTLFTIGLCFNEGFQQSNFRQVGGYSHGGFKYLTEAQFHELKDDPLIQEYGLRRFVGMPMEAPFHKAHVELGYSDETQRKWMFLEPAQGSFPKEGSREAATDTRVLALLGIEPVLGTEFSLTFNVDGTETTEHFILSGVWAYDEAIIASHVLLPLSRAEEIFEDLGTTGKDGMTGRWNMDVMFQSAGNIAGNVQKVLENHGYQNEDTGQPDYIATGVNWGYTGAQFSENLDPITVSLFGLLLLLIIFTGYLIIYNVFQISVAGEVRFYGLLKTIGTTPRQLRRIIRRQASLLSVIGIPLGLIPGYAVGVVLSPVILSQLNGVVANSRSASPLIFIGSALFALLTVFLSCAKPGRMAAAVSPIEAIRYAEGTGRKKTLRKRKKGSSIFEMALANLGRSRGKTAVTVVSLSLAIVLLNLTFTFTRGFDMDKYLRNVVFDFTLADASYFQTGRGWNGQEVEDSVIEALHDMGGVTGSGRVYGKVAPSMEFVTEEDFGGAYDRHYPPEELERRKTQTERLPDGRLADQVQLYGMEDEILDKLPSFEGDLDKLKDPSGRYIAAVYSTDDYDKLIPDSHWAALGDTVTIRHIDELEYYNPDTGEVYEGEIPENAAFTDRIVRYRDIDYEVAALVVVPHNLSYRFFGADEFILGAETFVADTGTSQAMYYAFDAAEDATAGFEDFLSDFTKNSGDQYHYESKQTYQSQFESFRQMFLLLGGVLSAVLGLVGILNFLNAVLTGMIARRKEFAMLQSIGMTGRQLKAMLIWESLFYTLGSVLACLLLFSALGAPLGAGLERVFWFFTYRFTVLPILACIPLMLLISLSVPALGYRVLVRQSIVERLREVE